MTYFLLQIYTQFHNLHQKQHYFSIKTFLFPITNIINQRNRQKQQIIRAQYFWDIGNYGNKRTWSKQE